MPSRLVRAVRWRALLAPLLLTAALLSGLAFADDARSQAIDLRDENSWLRIQNVGTRPATVELSFYDPAGNLVGTDGCPRDGGCVALNPGFGWSFFQQTNATLPAGYRGSGYVTVDQPFVGLVARDVLRPDGEFQIAGDSLRLGTGGSRYVLPLVVNNPTAVSRIVVENTSETGNACVEILYYLEGESTPLVDPATPAPNCPQGGASIPPRGTLKRDELSLPVAFGFDGAAVVRTRTTGSGTTPAQQQISVIHDTRTRVGAGLATYRGIVENELSSVVLLPLVDRDYSEGQSTFTTRFRITNGDPAIPNEVNLLFAGRTAAGEEFEVEQTIFVTGSRTCDLRLADAGGCLPDGQTLPASFSGTVRMQSVDPIAVVAQRLSSDGSLADYRGFTAEEASRQIVLPVLNRNYGPFGGKRGWNSWFRVLTFDGSVAHVFVVYYSKAFPQGLISPTPTRVDGQKTFRQWEERSLPDGWVGSAVIVADRPVVVLANLESDVFTGDPVMLYNGVSIE